MYRTRIVITGLVAGALLLGGAVFAIQSQGPGQTAMGQALTSGGGASASASYTSPQQAFGSLTGALSNSSYVTTVGAVQPAAPPPPEQTSVEDWLELNH